MINGHGDDAYRYSRIVTDFSSNICPHAHHEVLQFHLSSMPWLLSHYPEPEAWSLEAMIAKQHGIKPQQVIVTNGATEAIYLIAQAFRMIPEIPQPTFSEYEDACQMFPPTTHDHSILWLCNPNNPTGDVYDFWDVIRMLLEHDLVVIDQSYEHYTDQLVMDPHTAVGLSRVIQIHSLTKTYGVPGLRLGYITAHEWITERIRTCMRPWSVSAVAVEAGKFLLQHDELMCVPDLNEAQRLRDHLSLLGQVKVQDTKTNFMLCQLAVGTAEDLKDYLALNHGMLIRDASNFQGLTDRHFRVAAQSPEEDDALVAAIQQYLQTCTK